MKNRKGRFKSNDRQDVVDIFFEKQKFIWLMHSVQINACTLAYRLYISGKNTLLQSLSPPGKLTALMHG